MYTIQVIILYMEQSDRSPQIPTGSALVCDASSNIFSKPIDIKNYSMIYAGSQKKSWT